MNTMEPKETKIRILDAAEHLFAENGYHGTSLRMITSAADANLAAVNYHFGSKEALIQAVIERKLLPLNQIRTNRLNSILSEAETDNTPPGVRQVLAAFVEPTLSFKDSGSSTHDFITLISRAMADSNDTARNIFIDRISPVFTLLHRCLVLALPHIDPKIILLRIHFMVGSLGHIMHDFGNLPIPPELQPSGCDPKEITELLLTFLTTGMEAPQ